MAFTRRLTQKQIKYSIKRSKKLKILTTAKVSSGSFQSMARLFSVQSHETVPLGGGECGKYVPMQEVDEPRMVVGSTSLSISVHTFTFSSRVSGTHSSTKNFQLLSVKNGLRHSFLHTEFSVIVSEKGSWANIPLVGIFSYCS